jgi:uncharacterized protein (TIGR03663 family)
MSGAARVAGILAIVGLAAALRLPDLPARPMHADEAIHADKFGTLLAGGGYVYDPSEYHGPTLYYMTLVPAWLRGERTYRDLDETTLRIVPAALGVLLVAAHALAAPFLGSGGALAAALLAALSPAMVYYSRDYIHEVPLVLFTFAVLAALGWYTRRPGPVPALVAGAGAGLMLATKETAVLALGSMAVAAAALRALERGRDDRRLPASGPGRDDPAPPSSRWWRDGLLALLGAALVGGLLFSSFLLHPGGVADAARAVPFYLERATAPSWHIHPWCYYVELLVHFPAEGAPFWTEGLILGLAVAGAVAGWIGPPPGPDRRAVRFLALYTLALTVAYSAIPYKTPWCVLSFLDGMVLLAGVGAVMVLRTLRGRVARGAVATLLLAGGVQLGTQARAASFGLAADPRNPWVYAHTSTDVFVIAGRVQDLARVHPDGDAMPVQVISRENLWPLPWYFRRLTHVEWWTGVSDEAKSAPVILLTPDMEPALVRKLYDLPPPGERELYVSIFPRPVELRPQVELRGYAAASLWDRLLRREAESAARAAPSADEARR